MRKLIKGLIKFLSVNTLESSTRLFAFIIIAISMISLLAIVTVFIILLFKGLDTTDTVSMVIALGSIALGALAGKVFNNDNKSIKEDKSFPIDNSQIGFKK